MQILSADSIILRIDAARRARPGGAVAFDGDGTLWSGDVGDDLFKAFLAKGRVELPARAAIEALARELGVSSGRSGTGLAAAIYEGYLSGHVPEEPVCEMMAYACAGWPAEEVEAFVRGVVLEGRLEARWQAEVTRVVRWAADEGVEAFVVSASPVSVVLEASRALGFDAAHVVAATPIERDGLHSAEVARPIPYGAGKVTRLAERMGARTLYAAFGDNVFDIPLLRSAEVAVAVRPKPRLVARAGEVPGLVEIERLE